MNLHNIKLALRNLKRHRLYSILSITGFSVGFAVCLFVTLFLYNELTMDTCYPNYKNTALIYESQGKFSNLDIKLHQDLKEKYPEILATCPMELINFMEIAAKSDLHYQRFTGLLCTTNDFFTVFPLKVLVSSGKQPFDGQASVLLTKSFAKQLFPNEDPMGKSITVLDFLKGRVTGIVEDFPKNSSIQAKVMINAENPGFLLSQNCNNGRCWNPLNHFVVLRPGTNRTALAGRMSVDFSKSHEEIKTIALQPLQDVYMSPIDGTGNASGNRSLNLILLSVGLVVLVLSTINFLNFYVSMQFTKLREIGIKMINGASYSHLLRFSLSEVSVSILFSVVFALALFALFLPWGNNLFERNLEVGLLLNPGLLLILLLLVTFIILLNSLAPLSILNKLNTSSFLSKMQVKGDRRSSRRWLTLMQLTASMVLMAVVFALFQQISYAKNAELGFQKEHLLRLKLPIGFKSQDAMKQKLAGLTCCQNITLSRGVPGSINLQMGEGVNGKTILLKSLYVDEDFFKTTGIQLVAGREFLPGDMGNACLLNEEAVRQYGWDTYEGKRFNNGRNGGYLVVGVVKDFHIESMHEKIKPVCMMAAEPGNHGELGNITIRLASGNLGSQMEQLRDVWKQFISDEPMNFSFYDDQFDAMYRKDDQLGKAIGVISLIALILTFMGILGQVFQISLNRTKEIGVRKVNGATVSDILAYMNKEFILWVFVALVIAIPFAWYLIHRWMENFAYKTEIGWPIYAASAAIMFTTVVLTVTLQSWKAATVNPVEALRYE
ncbi:MAG: ABC transporter permease [Marinilabiliales bacterium]|nr:ABC transporter permease [Marinilabiliales bacterium]